MKVLISSVILCMLLVVFPIEAQQGRVIRVIVITSKSGASKERGVNVEFNSFMQYSPKMDVAYLNPYASSAEVIDYEQRGFDTNFFGGPWSPIPNSNTSLTGSYSKAVEAMNELRLGFISSAELEGVLADLRLRDILLPFLRQFLY